jgi:hypothetical protein
MSEIEFECLVAFTREDVLWLCPKCVSNFRKDPLISENTIITKVQAKFEKGLSDIKAKVENISTKLRVDLD